MLHGCRRCTCRFAPDATACPQCGSNDRYEVGSADDPTTENDVSKISKTSGLTDELDPSTIPNLSSDVEPDEDDAEGQEREVDSEIVTVDDDGNEVSREPGNTLTGDGSGERLPDADETETEARISEGRPGVADADDATSDTGDGRGEGADPAAPVRPAGNASTQQWEDHAIALEIPLEQDREYTRAELIELVDKHDAERSES